MAQDMIPICDSKQCTLCKQILPIDSFRLRKNRSYYYRQAKCRTCESISNKENWYKNHEVNKQKLRNKRLFQSYGITREDFDLLLEKQNHSCAICNCKVATGKGTWHVDHDHVTNKVRGLLCHHCNTALGLFKDDPIILKKAINYLYGS